MRKILLLPCLFVSQTLIAGESLWTDISPDYQSRSNQITVDSIHTSRKLTLNYESLALQLSESSNTLLEFPMPDGSSLMLRAEPSSIMAPELAAKFPQIKTWRVYDPNNPNVTGSIDIGPNGFHGFIQTADGDRIFIDPDSNNDNSTYTALSHRNSSGNSDTTFSCELHDHSSEFESPFSAAFKPSFSSAEAIERSIGTVADPLITYRIAIAATGEYTQIYGGTKENAMAGINTTISRVNQIFERDLGILLEVVGNNNDIIYTSPNSDPYSNEDATAMVDENVVNTNAIIGVNNYDIGHVFGSGNTGGLAFLNSACGTFKAGGVTGSNSPRNDAFNVDYVAHEIGHQIGASHTFNGFQLNCSGGNRESDTAVEPGSGNSIMGYAGICGSDNLQSNSDAFFHSVSINEIKTFTREGSGSSCGTTTVTTNNSPTVDAGNNHTIPAGTPFALAGSSSDSDGDIVSHSWEQIDTGDVGGLYNDLGNNPLFRMWPPTTEATRFFPRLSDQIDNQTTIGELLPTTTRSLNFVLLARDNNGATNQDTMSISVVNTGENFAVTSQTDETSLSANQTIQVSWDIAATDAAPINCSVVDINLLEDSGNQIALLENTVNDGNQSVTIPNDIFTLDNAKLQVACRNNIFFALSQGKVSVLGGSPVLSVNSPTINEGDNGAQNISFILSLSSDATETMAIDYTITDEATNAVIQRGQAIIIKGDRSAIIHAAVAGDTLSESDQILLLTINKPSNAQFISGEDVLVGEGTIVDDDQIAANPVANTSVVSSENAVASSSGGGSFGIFSMLGLVFLAFTRRTYKGIKS
ncbi:reprolysin-like metallopeptidase [Leucothrix arctica]|uniref:Peptidase M12B domain-containing protein n=1 Tax=Leucothrix arctica TaxID=1481894 RepID=A0A317C7P3_9GAMM|nr:zinc-dependent metalloprotease family protein [Leucothrix arctica]PWQ94664.1 hypothetical protein DKT75_15335 [Leucothrix arctica]